MAVETCNAVEVETVIDVGGLVVLGVGTHGIRRVVAPVADGIGIRGQRIVAIPVS